MLFCLDKIQKAGIPKERLKDAYVSIMRSVLEFSSNVYHSQLTKFLSNPLEKMQKRLLKLIYGYDKSYEELLAEAGLEKLEER